LKILVTGADGQLGHDIIHHLEKRNIECCGVDIADFDLTDAPAVLSWVKDYRPSRVIHCAAYTAVDKAEEQKELCTAVNVTGTQNIAAACKEIGAPMMYISTDYVFDGITKNTPWETDDPKAPINHYGQTKYEGELAVQNTLSDYFIVRICWVFGKNGHNFVKTMLRLAQTKNEVSVVDDQFGAPTYTYDAAKLMCDMIVTDRFGVYHACNETYISWHEFACEIFRQAGISMQVNALTSEQYPSKAKRPKNSRLSKKSLDEAGFARLPDYKNALSRYLAEMDMGEKQR
jgi:dTDP-4-dehydrorhamnose reductase